MNNVVFLIGAGRSGTTLLYKLLALHSEIGVITNHDQRLAAFSPGGLFLRAIRHHPGFKKSLWFSEGGNAYFRPGLKRILPYPVEGESVYTRCGVPLVIESPDDLADNVGACLRKSFARLGALHGGKVFLTKRTANNRRLEWLRRVFPEARFINLIRDGREVAHSLATVKWWDDHVVWWAGKTPRELEDEGWDRLRVCAKNWVEEVGSLEKGVQGLPSDNRLDVRYEDLLTRPTEVMQEMLAFMGLGASDAFLEVVQSLGLRNREPKWRSNWDDEQERLVTDIEQDLLMKHGYI